MDWLGQQFIDDAISIHAPARGATKEILPDVILMEFQSTLPRGERHYTRLEYHRFAEFQSTLPRGERHCVTYKFCQLRDISIHAPARGATESARCSTSQCSDFNPRSREGSDNYIAFQNNPYTISIHAPARGATTFRLSKQKTIYISIHAPARGATKVFYNSFRNAQFQSTLPRGERRRYSHTGDHNKTISIHAPARGATSILSKIHPMFLTISHNASSFSSFPFHSFLPHLLNSSTFCALFQVRISRAFSVYYRFAPKKSTPDL